MSIQNEKPSTPPKQCTIYSLTPPSSGGKTPTSVSLLSQSPNGTSIGTVEFSDQNKNGEKSELGMFTETNSVIQFSVMCDLPISQGINSSNGKVEDPSTDSIVAMKAQPVPVLLTTSTDYVQQPLTINLQTDGSQPAEMPSIVKSPFAPKPASEDTGSKRKYDSVVSKNNNKIGRPRKDEVELLKAKGMSSTSELKCLVCKRVFPRIKSLEAHMRIHTGEKPYLCDFPHCDRSFNQSGQLRTHHRLHTGEKPFKCDTDHCENRYAHANRTCPLHPDTALKRFPIDAIETDVDAFPNKDEVATWLYRYGRDHRIPVEIIRYDNPTLKAQVMAELVVLSRFEPEDTAPPVKKPATNVENTRRSSRRQKPASKDKSEIQGALALMELARN